MPLRGNSGLSVPVFGPLAETSVLLPAYSPKDLQAMQDVLEAMVDAPPKPSGKRKEKKKFRVPGESRRTEVVTGYAIIPGDHGRTGVLRGKGRTQGNHADGAAALAEALLAGGVLKESDWCGGLERTISGGLTRWVNEEKGASSWRWFSPPLTLVLTDDSPAYSTGVLLGRWRDHMRLPASKPVGFFGLRFQSQPKPVHVRRVVEAVEAGFPGVGFGLMNLLDMTFITAVRGYTPHWGMQISAMWDALDEPDREMEREMLGLQETGTAYDFGDCVPAGAYMTPFRLDLLDAAILKAKEPKAGPDTLPVLLAARGVFDACRRAGKRFHLLNHCQFLSWQMSIGERSRGSVRQKHIDRLNCAPVVYTVWDADNDIMTRLVDDYTEYARSTWQYTDLSWMHCYQEGGSVPAQPASAKYLEAHDRRLQKLAKQNPDALAFHDKEYVKQPMPDGSIGDAVTALGMVLDILGALDKLLTLLHTPETLCTWC